MASRRSIRLKAVQTTDSENNSEGSVTEHDDADFVDEPAEIDDVPTKKRKQPATRSAAAGPSKRRKGRLSQLTEFPLDVLLEIFAHLHPYDLLRLARTTKDIRSLLMRKSALSIWRTSLATIEGLPELPDDMSEPAYVNLAFDPHCHICDAPSVHSIQWGMRKRVCRKCEESDIFVYAHNAHNAPYQYHHALDLTPYMAKFKLTNGRRRGGMGIYYYAPQLDRDAARILAVKDDPAALAALRTEMTAFKKMVQRHAALATDWSSSNVSARDEELDEIRLTRRNAIVARLQALGWRETLTKIQARHGSSQVLNSSILKLKGVNVARKLTNKEWSDIQGPIITILQEDKERIAQEERVETIQKRTRLAVDAIRTTIAERQSVSEALPSVASIALSPPFKDVILQEPIDDQLEVTSDHFIEAISTIPQYVQHWRQTVDSELLKLIHATGEVEATAEAFKLAKTVFLCKSCYAVLFYPAPLDHSCRRFYPDRFSCREDTQILAQMADRTAHDSWSYTGRTPYVERISFAQSDSEFTQSVMKLHSLDPLVTTTEQMRQLDPWLVYAYRHSNVFTGTKWQQAIKDRIGSGGLSTIRLMDEEEREILADALQHSAVTNIRLHKEFECLLCRRNGQEFKGKRLDAFTHFKESHEDKTPDSYNTREI